MASSSRAALEEPPPYVERAPPQPKIADPPAEILPEYSLRPIPLPLTLDDEPRTVPRRKILLKYRFAVITLAMLVVVGIVTGYLVYKKKQAEKIQDPPSPVLALAACECDTGTFIVTQSNESWHGGFYLTGGVRHNNSGLWSFENERILIQNDSASVKGPNYGTNLTTFIHIFYISGAFEISEAVIRIPSLVSPPKLVRVTKLANVRVAPQVESWPLYPVRGDTNNAYRSISAIYHTILGIRLYYLDIPKYPDARNEQTMLTEMTWTNATGWSAPSWTPSNAHDPGAAFAVCVLDGARLSVRNETKPILNDTIHVFYANVNDNLEHMKWNPDLGWGMVFELSADYNKPAHKITNIVAILPTYSYNEPMIFYVSSHELHQIVVTDAGYFWSQTLDKTPDASRSPLVAAVTNPTAHNHEYDSNLFEAPQTQVFYVLKSSQWKALIRVSHYVTTFLWDKEMTGPGVGVGYVQLT